MCMLIYFFRLSIAFLFHYHFFFFMFYKTNPIIKQKEIIWIFLKLIEIVCKILISVLKFSLEFECLFKKMYKMRF